MRDVVPRAAARAVRIRDWRWDTSGSEMGMLVGLYEPRSLRKMVVEVIILAPPNEKQLLLASAEKQREAIYLVASSISSVANPLTGGISRFGLSRPAI